MITFFVSIIILFGGYLIWGKLAERIFGIDPKRKTPAFTHQDGVDYVPIKWWRVFLIQFLNIAGLGPIFGAILGATFGPVAFIWIVFGGIFAGAIHDYFSAMLSMRNDGLSMPEVIGKYLGTGFKQFMRVFILLLMILVGAVFITGPAGILQALTPQTISKSIWVWIIIIYYLLATLLPIDKIIGKIYPIFGFAILFMAFGILIPILLGDYHLPELTFTSITNMKTNASSFPIFPMLFVTIACGAISGFHSTQSPLMARCLTNENLGRRVFYGAMIVESVIALIWAAVGMAFFGGINELNLTLAEHNNDAAWAVNNISNTLLGKWGAILAIIGVVVAPITSGDTAFRSARLIIADFFKIKQDKILKRILICIPIFAIGILLTQIKFDIIWRYMAWSNQTLATIVLWAITVFLAKERKFFWISLIPALFMTSVVITYILVAPEGFSFSTSISYPIALTVTLATSVIFIFYNKKIKKLNV